MVSFDPETNCVEAFDVSGYVDVYIDRVFHFRYDFAKGVKIRLVLKPNNDVGSLDNERHTFSNDLANTGDRQVGSEHSASISCGRQGDPSTSSVTIEDTSSIFKKFATISGSSTGASIAQAGLDSNAFGTSSYLSSLASNTNKDGLNLNVLDRDKCFRGTKASGHTKKSWQGNYGTSVLSCEFCGKTFASAGAEHAHRLNPNCLVKCIFCNTVRSSKGSLFRHYCQAHPNVEDLKEQFGNDYSSVNLKLFRDQKVCPLCVAPLSYKDCAKHFDRFHFTNQLFLCCVCGQDFSTEHLWNEHCHKEHGRLEISTHGALIHGKRKHMDMIKGEEQQSSVNDGKEYQCKYCGETFTTEGQLLSHPKRKTMIDCKQCGRFCQSQAELIIHEREIHGSGLVCEPAGHNERLTMTECPLCLVKIKTRSILLSHIRQKHTKETLYMCCVCGKDYCSRKSYIQHCTTVHTSRQKGPFQCSVCKKTFDSESAFNSHKSIHWKTCRFCGEKFLLVGHLQQHYLEKHEDSLIPCDHCDRKFPSESTLRTHQRYIRFCPRQPCPKCGLMLRRVKNHMKLVHPDVEREAQCNICGIKVKSEWRLRAHMRRSHKNNEVSCSVCSKVLKNSFSLNTHLRTVHFVEKMYECQICGKKCTKKSNLTVHMRIHSDTKKFSCTFCNQGFNYKASLLSHMRSKHPGVGPTA